jgi:hypothetical protein
MRPPARYPARLLPPQGDRRGAPRSHRDFDGRQWRARIDTLCHEITASESRGQHPRQGSPLLGTSGSRSRDAPSGLSLVRAGLRNQRFQLGRWGQTTENGSGDSTYFIGGHARPGRERRLNTRQFPRRIVVVRELGRRPGSRKQRRRSFEKRPPLGRRCSGYGR